MLEVEKVKAILKPQFVFLGKSFKGEPLWLHSFSLWSIVKKLIKFIPRFNDREKYLLEITSLIHDIGKISEKNQSILSGEEEGKVKHTMTKDGLRDYFVKNTLIELLKLSEDDIDFIYHAHLHHNLLEEALKTAPPSLAIYADIVRFADWISSQERLDRRLIHLISGYLEPFCQITVVNISRIEGPSNYLLFETAYNIYNEMGWEVLIVLSKSLLLISPINTPYPDKRDVLNKFQENLVRKSLSLQKPDITNFTSVFLGGESAKNPALFIYEHKKDFIDVLGDFDRAPLYFFKILIELLDKSEKLTSDLKKEYPFLDILKGLCGTRGIPIARKKWIEMGGNTIEPLKEMLKEIFNKIKLEQVIPSELIELEEKSVNLKELTSQKLYNILFLLAEKLFSKHIDNELQTELNSLISMEEEVDFNQIALERFIRYKEYKKTQNPEKGICETCGFTSSFSAQKSLKFPGDKCWGFSQINPHTGSARATCTLCAYDTMMMRKNISERQNQIYIRIESKSPDLWNLYDEIIKLIKRLKDAFTNPYSLESFDKCNSFFPLPSNFKIPKFREPKEIPEPLKSIRGYIIPIDNSGSSPKDSRAKYLSLFALLKMMGFDTNIGYEEQSGLFGDNPVAKHGSKYETIYYRGLAIILFANVLDKANKYIFAELILDKTPSVALTKLGDIAADKEKGKYINKDKILHIIEAIVKGDLKIKSIKNGGEYSMKELLQDAAFFAEGIPLFLWTQDDHKAWFQNSSKHIITKPVSKTMNCILQGDDFETAFAKFLSLIRDNISSDKTKVKEGSEPAKVDIADLRIFVEKSKERLKRYFELREEDISAFIQAKNALLSSIYLLKRYPNLKEVTNG